MADDLGSRLVQAGLVTPRQLSEVLGHAPPHEGALVKALAAAGLSEDGLAGFFVAKGFGPLMHAADLAASEPDARAKVPGAMAKALLALPVRSSPAGLVVAMAAPTDSHALNELARAAGGPVLAAVARVGDLADAIARAHPEIPSAPPVEARESEPPVLELVNVRRRPATPPEGYYGSTRGAERVEARATVGPHLVGDDTEAFVPLVRTKPVQRSKDPPAAPEKAPGFGRKVITQNFETVPKDTRVVPVGETARAEAEAETEPAAPADDAEPGWAAGRALRPPGRRPPATKAPRSERDEPRLDPKRHGLETADTVVEGAGAASPASPPAPEAPRPPTEPEARSIIPDEHARWGSLSDPENKVDPKKVARMRSSRPPPRAPKLPDVGKTLSRIRNSRERDEVVELACEGALTVSRAAVFLALRKSVLKGWGGAGTGVSLDAVRNLWIPTSSPSMFREVVAKKESYHGTPGAAAADGLFRAALGSRGGAVSIHPVLVGTKLVAVLAADDVRFGDSGRERIETLAQAVSEAFERIIVESKRR